MVTETREHRGDKREIPEDAQRRKVLKHNNKEQQVTTPCRPVTPEVVRGSAQRLQPSRGSRRTGRDVLVPLSGVPIWGSAHGTLRRQTPQRAAQTRLPCASAILPKDGSKDGCEGQRGHFKDIFWSKQRRERIEMIYNEHQGTGVRRPCKAAVIGSMAAVLLLLLSIPTYSAVAVLFLTGPHNTTLISH